MDNQEKTQESSNAIPREVITNAENYREVSLEYRIFRSSHLRLEPLRENRLHCPMVDASRSEWSYGVKTLRHTTKKAIKFWANALGSDKTFAFLLIAYLSGPLSHVPRNFWKGHFNEDELNTGFITQLKDSINTGILAQGFFDQQMFDNLIGDIHPSLKGKVIDEDCLYTDVFADFYIQESDLKKILSHNINNRKKDGLKKFIGAKISKFEMGSLLLGLLSQPINSKEHPSSPPTNAMLIRDLFDFYKYGWFPAHIEEGFLNAGLLNEND